jgi:hypothetical protein
MEPAPAKQGGYYGEPLSNDEFKALVKDHIRAFKDGDNVTVVVSTAPKSPGIRRVVTCTHPPCW